MTETQPSPTAAAEARDFDEYKRLRNSAPQPAVESADSPAEGDTSASDAYAESGSVSETGDTKSQRIETKGTKPKKDRSLDGRISELTGKLKAAEEDRLKLRQQLEEARKGVRAPEATQPQQAETKTPPQPATGEPDFEKILDAAIHDSKNTTYEKAQAAALREYHKQARDNERARAEAQRSQSEAQTAHEARLAKTRERHADFDEVVAAAIPQVEGVHNPGIEAAMAGSDSAEVVYYFASHLDEFRKIAQMTPQAAYRATVALDIRFSSERQTIRPARSASRAPEPPAITSGTTTHAPKDPAEARDYMEYKRLRKAVSSY